MNKINKFHIRLLYRAYGAKLSYLESGVEGDARYLRELLTIKPSVFNTFIIKGLKYKNISLNADWNGLFIISWIE